MFKFSPGVPVPSRGPKGMNRPGNGVLRKRWQVPSNGKHSIAKSSSSLGNLLMRRRVTWKTWKTQLKVKEARFEEVRYSWCEHCGAFCIQGKGFIRCFSPWQQSYPINIMGGKLHAAQNYLSSEKQIRVNLRRREEKDLIPWKQCYGWERKKQNKTAWVLSRRNCTEK